MGMKRSEYELLMKRLEVGGSMPANLSPAETVDYLWHRLDDAHDYIEVLAERIMMLEGLINHVVPRDQSVH